MSGRRQSHPAAALSALNVYLQPKPMTQVTYHSLIPDDGHPLFGPIGSFRDQGKVVLPNSFLSSVEGAVGAASNLEVSTGKDNDGYLRYVIVAGLFLKVKRPFACWQQQL